METVKITISNKTLDQIENCFWHAFLMYSTPARLVGPDFDVTVTQVKERKGLIRFDVRKNGGPVIGSSLTLTGAFKTVADIFGEGFGK